MGFFMQEVSTQAYLDSYKTLLFSLLQRAGGSVLIAVFFWVLYRLTRRPLSKLLKRFHLEASLIHLLVENMYPLVLVLVGIVAILNQFGVNITASLAGIGIAGVAVGFAAQDSLSNIVAGFIIFWDKPFRVGHWIYVGELYGQVKEITMRSTRIKTLENTFIVIPNQRIINEVLTNQTKNGKLRLNAPIGIAFKESVDQAREVLLEAVEAMPLVRTDPAPDVVVQEIGESSVDLLVRVWIDDAADENHVYHEVLERCKNALDEAGIQIPFPHRQLFLDAVDEGIWEQVSKHRRRKDE